MVARENHCEGLEIVEDTVLLMTQLFREYAKRIPRFEDLWSGLAEGQIQQARSISRLRAQVRSGRVWVDESRFDLGELRVFRDYLKGLLYKAVEKEQTEQAAIEAALYTQWAVLKQEMFAIREQDPEPLSRVLSELIEETCRRRDQLLKALEKAREPAEKPEPMDAAGARPIAAYRVPDAYAAFTHLGYLPMEM